MQTSTPINVNSNSVAVEDRIEFVDPKKIDATVFKNTRRKKAPLPSLVEAIRHSGVIQSVVARELDDGKLILIAGFTRHEIACGLNLPNIPCLIRKLTDQQAMEIHLEENLCRKGLTITEEARAAASIMAYCEGDKKEAASRLGWSLKNLNDRLQLNRCIDEVLEKVDSNDIKLGHAIILSSFSETVQKKTLVKIIDESWTVDILRKKADDRNRALKTAKFDTKDCETCPYNTVHQMDIFDSKLNSTASCAKIQCFKDKTVAWLEVQKTLASEKHGKVLYWFEANEQDRNTVNEKTLGKSQIRACETCSSNVAIMDDRIGKEGEIIPLQCVDKACYSKCANDFKKQSTEEDKKAKESPNDTAPKDLERQVNKTEVVKPFNLAKTSGATEKLEYSALASKTFECIADESNLAQAYMIAMLSNKKHFDFKGKERTVGHSITSLLSKTREELDTIMKEIVYEELSSNKGEKSDCDSAVATLLEVCSAMPNKDDIAVNAWTPSKAILNAYTIQGITALCKESGFLVAFNRDEENIEQKITFGSLSKSGKDNFIESILKYEFDWSNYAPSSIKAKV